jgi:hypothetical protein
MAKQRESASCGHGTKFHLWKKRRLGPNGEAKSGAAPACRAGHQHAPGGRDEARLRLYKKATIFVQRYFTLSEGRRGKRCRLSYYLLSRRFEHDPLQRIA